MTGLRIASLSLILLYGGPGVAWAQAAGPDGAPAGHRHWDVAGMRENAKAREAQRTTALHDVLGIQSSQEPLFAAFVAAMRPPEWDHAGDRLEGERGESMTTPERIDRRKAEMDRRFSALRQAFDRRAQATKALYAALDPRQRAVMDALPRLGGRSGGGEHGGRMGPRAALGSGM